MRVLFISLFLLACSGVASLVLGHEFYEPWCCNGKDCLPYHGKVEVTKQGYYVPEFNQLIPFKDAKGIAKYAEEAGTRYNVPDDAAEYHICMMPYDNGKIRCFYARPGGV